MPPTISSKTIWEHIEDGYSICVPVNCIVKKNGELVMGAGLAKALADRYPAMPLVFGMLFSDNGSGVYRAVLSDKECSTCEFITVPTKRHFSDKSEIDFIKTSVASLACVESEKVFVPQLGCGLGGLSWEKQVKPILIDSLDKRFVISG